MGTDAGDVLGVVDGEDKEQVVEGVGELDVGAAKDAMIVLVCLSEGERFIGCVMHHRD